jgi:hypothetical protein
MNSLKRPRIRTCTAGCSNSALASRTWHGWRSVLICHARRHACRANRGGGDTYVTIQTQDVQSFRRASEGQIGADISNQLLRARS